jgi:hypothetical protein
MGSWMPQLPPQLLQQALSRNAVPPAPGVPSQPLPQAQSLPLAQPGMQRAMGPPSPPPVVPPQGGQPMGANRVPRVPLVPVTIPPVQQPQGPASPKPSDDPAISGQVDPALKAAMASQTSAMAGIDQQQQAWQKHSAAAPVAPNYEDYKPPLWKKIAAPFLGALAAQGHGDAGGAVSSMLYGPWNRAQGKYGQQEKQWEEEGTNLGRQNVLASDQARVAQEGVTNQLNVKKEAETEKRDTANAQYKSDFNEIRQEYDRGRVTQEQENRLARIANQSENLDLRKAAQELQKQIIDLRDRDVTTRENKLAGGQTDKENPNGFTASEQREYSAKTRRFTTQIDALNRERAVWVGMPGDSAKKSVAKYDAELETLHGNLDKAESDIMDKRKSAGGAQPSGSSGKTGPMPGDTVKVHPKAPRPSGPNTQLKQGGQVVAYSADGKTWSAPRSSGSASGQR